MNERDRLDRGHIQDAIADIESFIVDGRDWLMVDRRTQSAVIRQLEIIGEAGKRPAQHRTHGDFVAIGDTTGQAACFRHLPEPGPG